MDRKEIQEMLAIDSISIYSSYPKQQINFHYKNGNLVSIEILDSSADYIDNVINEHLNLELSKLRELKINNILND
jgi:hypothetical protein